MNLIIWFRALELKATATKSEIKSAYYRLCQIYHPDKTNNCPKAVQRFRTINEAYEELMKAPINTINIKPKPSHTQPKPRYTESKQKYTERKTRYSPLKDRYTEFKAKYPPPKSKAHKTKSESTNRRTNHNTNEQSSNTKSKASSEQGKFEYSYHEVDLQNIHVLILSYVFFLQMKRRDKNFDFSDMLLIV